ncbi:MAG TPA: hypothetical protein VI874_03645, partial [Candidatus Norongarragalinales archaeon]|nr:hypothetical protein [Candidatus Norongarragalinales archaeon]
MKQQLSFGLKATRYPRFLGKTPRHERQGKPKGKKGFLTGLSAVLLFSALATLFAVEQMRTHQQESDLL